MLALIEYDKKDSPVVVKSPVETTHEGWIGRGKIAHEAIPFNAKYTELERFNALHTHFAFDQSGVPQKVWGNLNQIFYLSFLDCQSNG